MPRPQAGALPSLGVYIQTSSDSLQLFSLVFGAHKMLSVSEIPHMLFAAHFSASKRLQTQNNSALVPSVRLRPFCAGYSPNPLDRHVQQPVCVNSAYSDDPPHARLRFILAGRSRLSVRLEQNEDGIAFPNR